MGRLIVTAATQKDIPLLEAGVLIVGVIFLAAMLVADLLYSLLNPRIRYASAE
jgi:peptide/nickel transport system permease protein